jgi:hypothetical protein
VLNEVSLTALLGAILYRLHNTNLHGINDVFVNIAAADDDDDNSF